MNSKASRWRILRRSKCLFEQCFGTLARDGPSSAHEADTAGLRWSCRPCNGKLLLCGRSEVVPWRKRQLLIGSDAFGCCSGLGDLDRVCRLAVNAAWLGVNGLCMMVWWFMNTRNRTRESPCDGSDYTVTEAEWSAHFRKKTSSYVASVRTACTSNGLPPLCSLAMLVPMDNCRD